MKQTLLLLLSLAAFAVGLRAEDPAPAPKPTREERIAAAQKIVDGLHFREGTVALDGGLAEVRLAEGYRFLGPDDAETVLTRLWGNPAGKKPLGMVFPAGAGPLDDRWAVVLTYLDDGHVKDNDAQSIDYTKMMGEMQKATREDNPEREKQGYPPIDLVGWAEPPRYDEATHKMYWAKELKFGSANEETLNYDIRVLGRKGVLVLQVIAGMKELPDVREASPALLEMVDFTSGNRYADFKPGTDKVATYGLAALVVGGIAAKAGLFKFMIPLLLALKKFIVIGCVAVAAWFRRLFGKKKGPTPP